MTVTGNNIISSGATAITLSSDDVTVVGDLTVTGTSSGTMTLGADADGVDRSIVFGHTTLKSIMGIDDDQNVFAINTDGAFESANDFEIDASGNVTIKGDLTISGEDITSALRLVSTLAVSGLTTLNSHLVFGGSTPYMQFTAAQGFTLKDESNSHITCTSSTTTFAKASTFSGAVTCGSALTVSGITKLSCNASGTSGAGITAGSDTISKTSAVRTGDIVYTTIVLDVDDLHSDADDRVVGVDGNTDPAYLMRIGTGYQGTLIGGKLTCLEAPNADISLFKSTSGTLDEGDTASGAAGYASVCSKGSTWAAGDMRAFSSIPSNNDYLYLEGESTATFSSGRFIIEMWGVAS